MRHRCFSLTLASALALLGCSDGPTDSPADNVAGLDLADPLPPRAFVGTTLAPTVRVHDASNRPLAGVRVTFATARGTTTHATATSDTNGIARLDEWRLPTTPTVDTLVVTVPGSRAAAPLRIPMSVRPGPVARWVTLAPVEGTGTVLQSVLSGPAFQAFDPYDNPVSAAEVSVDVGPVPDAARVETAPVTDENGVVRIVEWTPRTLGTHTLQVRATDDPQALASATLTRDVRQPSCAASKALPDGRSTPSGGTLSIVTGTLGADAAAACADTVDMWALGATRQRVLDVRVVATASGANVPFRVVRADVASAAGLIVPTRAGRALVTLPTGEYVVVVGAGGAIPATAYEIRLRDWSEDNIFTSDTAWVLRGTTSQGIADTEVDAAGSGAARVAGKVYVVPMRDRAASRQLTLGVDAGLSDWEPILAAYGRSDADPTRVLLARATGTGTRRTLTLDVPAGYDEVLVLVGQAFPMTSRAATHTLRVD